MTTARPFTLLQNLPNAISVSRGIVGLLLLCGMVSPSWFLACFLFAAISDGLDGYLARTFGWKTPLGGTIDLTADGLFFFGADLALWRAGILPGLWLALILLFAVPQLVCQYIRWRSGSKIATVGLRVDKLLGAYSYFFTLALAAGGNPSWFAVGQVALQAVANTIDLRETLRSAARLPNER